MRIDEALGDSKPLAVKFAGGVLNIEYRTPGYTIKEMKAAESKKDDPEYLITMIQDLVQGWDLTRLADGGTDPETGKQNMVEVPVDVTNHDDVENYVPSNIIMGIVKAIREDHEVSGE